jgi:hypothetical protein
MYFLNYYVKLKTMLGLHLLRTPMMTRTWFAHHTTRIFLFIDSVDLAQNIRFLQ